MSVTKLLKLFNRKERFHLLHHALGLDGESFRLGCCFRAALGDKIGVQVPPDALTMMDYHLDWISAAVWLEDKSELPDKGMPQLHCGRVKGTQTDIDLIVAFEEEGKTHIVLIEAKGDSSWDNRQLIEKAKRLAVIFGSDEISKNDSIQPHFLLLSPNKPERVKSDEWPKWMQNPEHRMKVHWLELSWPDTVKPTLCDSDGSAKREGGHVRFECKNSPNRRT